MRNGTNAAITTPRSARFLAQIVAAALLTGLALAAGRWYRSPRTPNRARRGAAASVASGLPVYFERNAGQADPRARFLARAGAMNLLLTDTEAIVALRDHAPRSSSAPPAERRSNLALLHIKAIGATSVAPPEGIDPLRGHVNYFIGSDPRHWHTDISTYQRVLYRSLYPGVDLIYRASNDGLEYDLVLARGSDPARLGFAIEGARRSWIDSSGALQLATGAGTVTMRKPVVYEQSGRARRPLEGRYVIGRLPEADGALRVAIEVFGHDGRLPLVIDPQVVYSTYLGGRGSNKGPVQGFFEPFFGNQTATVPFNVSDLALDLALDSSGDIYVAGTAYSTDFPTVSATQLADATANDTANAFVAKLDPAQSGPASLIYSTYLGGSGNPNAGGEGDQANGIAVDGAGNAYIAGLTYSADFPHTPGAFETASNQSAPTANNGFVSELNPSGDGLLYSTFINGSKGAPASRIALRPGCASNCTAYVSGSTATTSGTDFPTMNAFESANPSQYGSSAAYLLVLQRGGSALQYSTFFGGSGSQSGGDGASGIAVDSAGNAYITGMTFSPDLPAKNPYQAKLSGGGGSPNAFVAEFDTGSRGPASMLYSSYLGGSGASQGGDTASGIAVDGSGHIFLAGTSFSSDFPTGPNSYQPSNKAFSIGGSNAFVAEIDPAQTGASQLVYATYLGGTGTPLLFFGLGEAATDIAVDAAGHIFVTGGTFSRDFPTTLTACQRAGTGTGPGANAFFSELDPGAAPANQLVFSTYLGGGGFDVASGLKLDSAGHAFLAGMAGSTDFPVTPGAFQSVNMAAANQSSNAFVTEIDPASDACESPNPTATPTATSTASLGGGATPTGSPATAIGTPTAAPSPGTLSVVPGAVAFGSIGVDTAATRALRVSNSGAGLLIGNVDTSGLATTGIGTPFIARGAGPFKLGHGRARALTIRFLPNSTGSFSGAIAISSNDPQRPEVSIAVSGSSLPGRLDAAPGTLRFGAVRVGKVRTLALTIRNTQAGVLHGSVALNAAGGPFSLVSGGGGFTLARGKARSVKVKFAPTSLGQFDAAIAVSSDDPAAMDPLPVPISGSGK